MGIEEKIYIELYFDDFFDKYGIEEQQVLAIISEATGLSKEELIKAKQDWKKKKIAILSILNNYFRCANYFKDTSNIEFINFQR